MRASESSATAGPRVLSRHRRAPSCSQPWQDNWLPVGARLVTTLAVTALPLEDPSADPLLYPWIHSVKVETAPPWSHRNGARVDLSQPIAPTSYADEIA